jgi:hypothetical protein
MAERPPGQRVLVEILRAADGTGPKRHEVVREH